MLNDDNENACKERINQTNLERSEVTIRKKLGLNLEKNAHLINTLN